MVTDCLFEFLVLGHAGQAHRRTLFGLVRALSKAIFEGSGARCWIFSLQMQETSSSARHKLFSVKPQIGQEFVKFAVLYAPPATPHFLFFTHFQLFIYA